MRDPEDSSRPASQRLRRGVPPPLRAGGRAPPPPRRTSPAPGRSSPPPRPRVAARPSVSGDWVSEAGMGRRAGRPLPRALDGAARGRRPPVRGAGIPTTSWARSAGTAVFHCCARARRSAGSISLTRTGRSGSTCWSGSPAVPRRSPGCWKRRALSPWSGRAGSCASGSWEQRQRRPGKRTGVRSRVEHSMMTAMSVRPRSDTPPAVTVAVSAPRPTTEAPRRTAWSTARSTRTRACVGSASMCRAPKGTRTTWPSGIPARCTEAIVTGGTGRRRSATS